MTAQCLWGWPDSALACKAHTAPVSSHHFSLISTYLLTYTDLATLPNCIFHQFSCSFIPSLLCRMNSAQGVLPSSPVPIAQFRSCLLFSRLPKHPMLIKKMGFWIGPSFKPWTPLLVKGRSCTKFKALWHSSVLCKSSAQCTDKLHCRRRITWNTVLEAFTTVPAFVWYVVAISLQIPAEFIYIVFVICLPDFSPAGLSFLRVEILFYFLVCRAYMNVDAWYVFSNIC